MGHIDENSRGGSGHPSVNGSRTQLHLFYLGAIRFDPLPDLRGGASPGRDRTGPLAGRIFGFMLVGSRAKRGHAWSYIQPGEDLAIAIPLTNI